MHRRLLALVLAGLLCFLPVSARGDDPAALRQALALQAAVQQAVKQAEPSVACILVSRSDVYRRVFHDQPPDDSPGKLGAFDASRREPPFARPGRRQLRMEQFAQAEEEQVRKYDLADPAAVPEVYGSGVVIDGQELLLLTNYHVVRDATKIYVRLPGNKGGYADIHAADPRSDLAVLRLLDSRVRPLQEIKYGDVDSVQKGQFVVSVANPFAAGFRDGSPGASLGIISNIRRRASAMPREEDLQALYLFPTLLQTDAHLHAGCSGGALLNLRGEMIGLTSARAALAGSELAGGFAVPMDRMARRIIDRLRQGKEVEYGFLGVKPQQSSTRSSDGAGVQISEIVPGSPAARASLHANDCIVSVNGIPLHDANDLFVTLGSLLAGTEVRLALRNSSQVATATLAKSYVPGKIIAANRPRPVRGFRVDYTSVLLTQLAPAAGFPFRRPEEIRPGVFVCEVQPGSPAASARLQVNDVITHISFRGARLEVNTPAEFYRAVERLGPRDPIDLTILSSDWSKPPTTLRID